ncbi:MAG: MATE family efflux transporter [Oscillospiraceae bacterium]|nr:MATE family efflux transporter [Oscillospiraceae bacterium]
MIKQSSFYRSLFALMIPMAIQNLFSHVVQLLGSIMVAYQGDIAVSAVNLGMQPYNVLSYFVYGICASAGVLISQAWGRKDMDTIHRVMALVFRVVGALMVVFSLLCFFIPRSMMAIYTPDTRIIEAGAQYLHITAFSYLLTGITQCYLSSLKAAENAVISTVVYSASLAVSLLLNYLLTYGGFGLPSLGVVGAAIATLVSRVVEAAIWAVYNVRYEKKVQFSFARMLRLPAGRELLRRYIDICIPVTAQEGLWGVAGSVRSMIAGHIGAAFITANSLSENARQLAMIPVYALIGASVVLMAKAVGAGEKEYAQKVGSTCLGVAVGLSLFSAVLILILRSLMPVLYPDISAESMQLLTKLINISAMFMLSRGLEYSIFNGILRGAGDARFAMVFDIGCMYLVALPLGYVAAFVWHLPETAVYALMWCDTFFKVAVAVWRILSGRFLRAAQADMEAASSAKP